MKYYEVVTEHTIQAHYDTLEEALKHLYQFELDELLTQSAYILEYDALELVPDGYQYFLRNKHTVKGVNLECQKL